MSFFNLINLIFSVFFCRITERDGVQSALVAANTWKLTLLPPVRSTHFTQNVFTVKDADSLCSVKELKSLWFKVLFSSTRHYNIPNLTTQHTYTCIFKARLLRAFIIWLIYTSFSGDFLYSFLGYMLGCEALYKVV